MEIISGVHLIDGTNANVYLLVNKDTLTIIDTGMPKQLDKILDYLKKMNRKPSEVSKIILTHCHIDHIGNAYELKKLTNAKLFVHQADAPFVSGREKMPVPKGLIGAAFKVTSPFFKIKYVEPDVLVKEGDLIDGFTVIHNPGHTPGSISLYSKDKKLLFAGDELRYMNGKIQGPPEQFTPDLKLAIKSMEKLTKMDYDIMLSGHGDPLRPNASEKVKDFYKHLMGGSD
jgi:glyoxylase-like metal-dependent hydrolase (beta-lactamase superfamily II)